MGTARLPHTTGQLTVRVCVCACTTCIHHAFTVANVLAKITMSSAYHMPQAAGRTDMTVGSGEQADTLQLFVRPSHFFLTTSQLVTTPPLSEVEGSTGSIHRTPQDPLLRCGPNSVVCCKTRDSHFLLRREDKHNGVGVVQGGVTWHAKTICNIQSSMKGFSACW